MPVWSIFLGYLICLILGIHAEGSVISCLFGLFFWDILFMDVPDAFHSPYQTHPLDVYTEEFYFNRQTHIDKRLEIIQNSSDEVKY